MLVLLIWAPYLCLQKLCMYAFQKYSRDDFSILFCKTLYLQCVLTLKWSVSAICYGTHRLLLKTFDAAFDTNDSTHCASLTL